MEQVSHESQLFEERKFPKVSSQHVFPTGTSYSPQYGKADDHDDKKGIAINELFQLALTAIAFLAFGMFFVHVIMCILGEEVNSAESPKR